MSNKNLKIETAFLFSTTNFFRGIGSAFNITGDFYTFNTSNSPEEADAKALRSDWKNVGNDIKKAKKEFEKKHQAELCL